MRSGGRGERAVAEGKKVVETDTTVFSMVLASVGEPACDDYMRVDISQIWQETQTMARDANAEHIELRNVLRSTHWRRRHLCGSRSPVDVIDLESVEHGLRDVLQD